MIAPPKPQTMRQARRPTQHADYQRVEARYQHRNHHGGPPPVAVAHHAEEPAADRAHEEAKSEYRRRGQQLRGAISGGEEVRGEV
jgi:hypothetical protein